MRARYAIHARHWLSVHGRLQDTHTILYAVRVRNGRCGQLRVYHTQGLIRRRVCRLADVEIA